METENEQSTADVLREALRSGPAGWWDVWCAALVWLHLAPVWPKPTGWARRDAEAEARWHRTVHWLGVVWALALATAVALVVVAL